MCTVLLPPGVNPIAVNKYIDISFVVYIPPYVWAQIINILNYKTVFCIKKVQLGGIIYSKCVFNAQNVCNTKSVLYCVHENPPHALFLSRMNPVSIFPRNCS